MNQMLKALKYAAAALISETGWLQKVFFALIVSAPNLLQSDAANLIKETTGIVLPASLPFAWSATVSIVILLIITLLKMAAKGIALEENAQPILSFQFSPNDIEQPNKNHKHVNFTIANNSTVKITEITARIYSIQVGTEAPRIINTSMYPERGDNPFNLRSGDHREIRFVYATYYADKRWGVNIFGLGEKITKETRATIRVICNENKFIERAFRIIPDDKDVFTIEQLN